MSTIYIPIQHVLYKVTLYPNRVDGELLQELGEYAEDIAIDAHRLVFLAAIRDRAQVEKQLERSPMVAAYRAEVQTL